MSPFETHKQILAHYLSLFNERVIEFGGGEASTPLIIEKSKASLTLENHREWYDRIKGLEKEGHEIRFTNDFFQEFDGNFDLAFVDCSDWMTRCILVRELAEKVKVILLHDSFEEHLDRCGVKFDFAYQQNYYLNDSHDYPPTIAFSNYVDVSKIGIPGCNQK